MTNTAKQVDSKIAQTTGAQEEMPAVASILKTTLGRARIYANSVTGELVTPTKKAGFSSIGVETVGFKFRGGFGRKQRTTALITMTDSDINDFIASYGLKIGSEIPGKVVVQESTDPFWVGQDPKRFPDNHPMAGAIITSGGNPVFRQTIFTEDLKEMDSLLTMDTVNVEVEEKELA